MIEDRSVTMTSNRVYEDDDNDLVLENLSTGEKETVDPNICYFSFESNYRIGAQVRWWDRSNAKEVWSN